MFVWITLYTNNIRLKGMKKIVFIGMHAVIIVISGNSSILKPGCDPFTFGCDCMFCPPSHVSRFFLVYRHCRLYTLAFVCFRACNAYDNVMLELWFIMLNKRSAHAQQQTKLIVLHDRGSLKSTKKIVIIDTHAVIMVIYGHSNILKPGCDPFTFSCD